MLLTTLGRDAIALSFTFDLQPCCLVLELCRSLWLVFLRWRVDSSLPCQWMCPIRLSRDILRDKSLNLARSFWFQALKLTINRKVVFIIVRIVLFVMIQIRVAILHRDNLLLLMLIMEHLSWMRELFIAHGDLRVLKILCTWANYAIVTSIVTCVGWKRKFLV